MIYGEMGLTDIVRVVALQHQPIKFLLCMSLLPKKMLVRDDIEAF
jgi:hypothetical protein